MLEKGFVGINLHDANIYQSGDQIGKLETQRLVYSLPLVWWFIVVISQIYETETFGDVFVCFSLDKDLSDFS